MPENNDYIRQIDDIIEDLAVGHNFEYAGQALKSMLANAILQSRNQAVQEAEKRIKVKTLRFWADFFEDPSMNAMTPSERLRSEADRLEKDA